LGASLTARSTTLPNDGYDPNANGIVNTLQLQPDGKILMGGYFTQLHPFGGNVVGCNYLARLNPNGTVDTGFSPSANGVVRQMVLQPNGQILVSGQFTALQPTGGGPAVTRNYVARLNTDGSIDPVFNPNANGVVYAMAVQPDGKVIIGGQFTTVQPTGSASPVTRNHVARFNTDGTLDTSFDPNTDRTVLSLAVQANGQVLIGGGFTTLQANGATSPTTRNCAARVNSDGSLDTSFDPEPNGSVMTILVLSTGQILFGGQFTQVQPNGATNYTQVDFLARLNADGTLDGTYIVNPLASVSALALQPDGKLLVGGTFTQIYPAVGVAAITTPYIARINGDGTVDGGFTASPNQAVNAIAIQPDGNIVIGGYFTTLSPATSPNPVPRNHIARITQYGGPDATLNTDAVGTVFATAALPNGQMMIGGTFISIAGITQNFLARLNADGSLDKSFAPVINGPVQAILVQTDGKVIIGGSFTEVDGIVRGYIARLNTDGTVDGPFNPSANSNVLALVLQSDGRILVGGGFTAMTPNGSTQSYAVDYLGRLNTDGSLDTTFNPAPNSSVFAIQLLPDGRIVVAGAFTGIAGANRSYVARLLSTGKIDPVDFDPEPNSSVFTMALQSDGKILIGGGFTGVIPQTSKPGTQLPTPPPAGTVVYPAPGVSAVYPIPINHLARINTDGTLDTTFQPDPDSDVLAVAVQSDGNILVGGALTSFAQNAAVTGIVRNYVGRVTTAGAVDPTFNPNANALVNSITLLPSGQILIGGTFTTLQPNGTGATVFAEHAAILNPDGSISPSFSVGANTAPNGHVNAIAQQANGQFLVGGTFGPAGGSLAPYLTRYDPDGSPDTAFYSGLDGPINSIEILPNGASTLESTNSAVWLESVGTVRHTFTAETSGEVIAMALQSDGKVILGGLFDDYEGSTNTSNLVRLNADGTLDTTFHATTNGAVNCIVIQPNGQILIGGSFTTVYNTSNSYLARLNADGTLDTTFAPQPNLQVLGIVVLPSGQIVAVGDFTYMAFNTTTSAPANYIARLSSTGVLDTTFEPEPNGPIYSVGLLPSGQLIVGGAFTQITPNLKTAYDVQYLAILNTDGTLDMSFYPDPNEPVVTMIVQANGQVIVGGTFSAFQQNPNFSGTTVGQAGYINPGPLTVRYGVARLNTSDGSIDGTFDPNPGGGLTAIVAAPNGQIYLGGTFSSIQPNKTGYPVSRSNVARVNNDGSLDPTFDPSINGAVDSVQPLPDGSVIVGGNFSSVQVGGAYLIGGSFAHVGGNAAANLSLLNNDGTYNSQYSANPNGPINAIAAQPNGQTLVGGSFTTIGGGTASNIARLNTDGTIDGSFSAPANATVNAIGLQANGQLLVGGAFTTISGQNSPYLARLGSTGAADASFAPVVNAAVDSVVVQPNGQIVIAGPFTAVDGQVVGGIARLNSDGTLDVSFNPMANGPVQALTMQTDGTFYVGGSFTSIGGQNLSNVAHLFSSGAVDTSFNPNPNAAVDAIAVQYDGKVLIGGAFTSAGGIARSQIARFAAPSPTSQSVTVSPDQSTVTWTLSGDGPLISSVTVEETTDGSTWTTVGTASSTDGATWEATNLPPAGAAVFEVRLTGITPSSEFSSAGLVQTLYLVDTLAIEPTVNSVSSVTAVSGTPFAFTVTATQLPKTFSATGLPPGLNINPTTGIITGTPTATGTYNAVVTVGNAGGSVNSNLTITVVAAGSGLSATANSADRLLNISTRADLPGNDVMIAGFVISGVAPKNVLVRAVGPGLAPFNVPGTMANTEIQLYSSSGALISSNTVWGGGAGLAAIFAQVGAFSLDSNSADSALVATLQPGSYTVHVFDPTGTGGVVLAEVYDADPSPTVSPERLVNISARGPLSPGAGTLIGGFVISGTANKGVLIRGIGPGLTAFGVTDAIPDPMLQVYDQNNNLVAQNAVWTTQTVTGPYQTPTTAAGITAADSSVGAFELFSQNADTAVLADLPPGSYTFQITSASSATGEALGEVYELP
jgi:uncharacterized delta-60 repeat protein